MRRRICEHCGAEVPPRATACPECGSDERTGWADEDDLHDALWSADAEDLDDDYESTIRDLGLGSAPADGRPRRDVILAILAAITVAAFVVAAVL